MGEPHRVFRRGGRWTFCVHLPEELRPIIGKRDIWQSLGTISHREAVRLSHVALVNADALFAATGAQLTGVDTGIQKYRRIATAFGAFRDGTDDATTARVG